MAKKGLGEEDYMHTSFAGILKGQELFNKLNCTFWSYDASGENRNAITGALLKRKGLKAGQPDYHFKVLKDGITHNIYIEFKTLKGKQSQKQIEFQESCVGSNEKYYIARSVEEGLNILLKESILKY